MRLFMRVYVCMHMHVSLCARGSICMHVSVNTRRYVCMHVPVCSNRVIACHFPPDQGDHRTRTVTWT
jgi:hypothetical protein